MEPIDAGAFMTPLGREVNPTADTDQVRARQINALRREREGYVVRGEDERVAAVDAELQRLEGPPLEAVDPAAGAAPKRRAEARPARATAKARKAEKRG
jgi:hypothetical protein